MGCSESVNDRRGQSAFSWGLCPYICPCYLLTITALINVSVFIFRVSLAQQVTLAEKGKRETPLSPLVGLRKGNWVFQDCVELQEMLGDLEEMVFQGLLDLEDHL